MTSSTVLFYAVLQPPSAAGPAPGAQMAADSAERRAAALKRATSLSAVRAAYLLTDLLTAGTLCESDGVKPTDEGTNFAQHDG